MRGGWLELYLSRSPSLFSSPKRYEEALFISYGFPFDLTSSFRPGSRFGPQAIRAASEGLESPFPGKMLKLADLGDLHPTNSLRAALLRAKRVVRSVIVDGKVPIGLGGEHTLALASIWEACKGGCGLIVFDAHFDMRNSFLDTRINNATWLRRLLEKRELEVMVVGVRGYEVEEKRYAEERGIVYYTSADVEERFEEVAEEVEKFASKARKIYLSIDIDVLDPAYAPGVGDPEPCGISPPKLYALLRRACAKELAGVDVVEVNPLFDAGQSALHAARAVLEVLSAATISSRA